MKLVIDENVAFADAYFASFGHIVRVCGRQMAAADVQDADVLIVRSVTQVNAALLSGSRVRFVGSCTIGFDHMDIAWLEQHNIAWACAPGCNASAVVEYVLAALHALSVPLDAGSRIGVIGCGNVGGALLRTLQAAGVPCCGYDPFLKETDLPLVDLATALACDAVCLHTPLTTTGPYPTFHMLDAAALAGLKPGAVLLNAGRGAVIDNTALLHHLRDHTLRVVLDVWENEPAINEQLLHAVNIGTPHIAGYSAEGKCRGTLQVYQALCTFLGVPETPVAVALKGEILPYDIAVDDGVFRAMWLQEGAAGFDRMRKQYVARREGATVSAVFGTSPD